MFIDIITGERLQQLAHTYAGLKEDFLFNPLIANQEHRWSEIISIPDIWDNPPLIFCYSHRIRDLSKKLNSIKNPCVIIFANSDENITYEMCEAFINSEKISHIFCQNLLFTNKKVSLIPIGVANKQWPHGDLEIIKQVERPTKKIDSIFCSFNVTTKPSVRAPCLNILNRLGIKNTVFNCQRDYINSLKTYRYSICPEGNGIDTHRFWESLYVETVPIVLKSDFTLNLQSLGYPCVLIDSWDSFSPETLPPYQSFNFEKIYYSISLTKFRNDILNRVSLIDKRKTMNVVLSFIGTMPIYIVECIKQLRLFFDGPVYLIYNSITPDIKELLNPFSLIFINYNYVKSERFENIEKSFVVEERLNDRKELYKRSYERIYLLEILMLKRNLTDVWFMEIDILMFSNPNIFIETLKSVPYAYMYHKEGHCSSAILYVKDYHSIQPILNSLDNYSTGFMSEMYALNNHLSNTRNVTLFPLINSSSQNKHYWAFYEMFYTFIFDGATIGQYLFGVDPIFNDNKIIKYESSRLLEHIKIWDHGTFEWHKNDKGLFMPYFRPTGGELIPIANLHIHSKDLKSAVSYTSKD